MEAGLKPDNTTEERIVCSPLCAIRIINRMGLALQHFVMMAIFEKNTGQSVRKAVTIPVVRPGGRICRSWRHECNHCFSRGLEKIYLSIVELRRLQQVGLDPVFMIALACGVYFLTSFAADKVDALD